jgi:Xaa-Pro aminopeptidase
MAIGAIRAGRGSRDIDAVARRHIEHMGFAGKFGHGLGHGVGLAVHEPPRLSPLKDSPLIAGMVTTVEPGIYLEGWGGVRLENMVVVRAEGAEVLNRLDAASCPVEL